MSNEADREQTIRSAQPQPAMPQYYYQAIDTRTYSVDYVEQSVDRRRGEESFQSLRNLNR